MNEINEYPIEYYIKSKLNSLTNIWYNYGINKVLLDVKDSLKRGYEFLRVYPNDGQLNIYEAEYRRHQGFLYSIKDIIEKLDLSIMDCHQRLAKTGLLKPIDDIIARYTQGGIVGDLRGEIQKYNSSVNRADEKSRELLEWKDRTLDESVETMLNKNLDFLIKEVCNIKTDFSIFGELFKCIEKRLIDCLAHDPRMPITEYRSLCSLAYDLEKMILEKFETLKSKREFREDEYRLEQFFISDSFLRCFIFGFMPNVLILYLVI